MANVSFLITCKNETNSLKTLLDQIKVHIDACDRKDEVVVLDDYSDNAQTIEILEEFEKVENFSVHKHHLNNNYGEHKTYGKSLCTKDFVFQIDSDELISETLLGHLHEILESNDKTELYWVPRINIFEGVTDEHARQWGWNINNPNKWVNWHNGDYQSRIFKNKPEIKWERRLHEKITGCKTFSFLPKEEHYALIHRKTIEKQLETNMRYNQLFTQKENMGI